MNGQLWEECFCGTEPVCASCMKCEKHCNCGRSVVINQVDTMCPEPYRRGIGQGFGSTEDGDF